MTYPGAAPPAQSPRGRWFQFRLRTLLILVTLIGGLLWGWRAYAEPYRRQRETIGLIKQLGGTYETAEADKWLRRIYGNDLQNVTAVNLADCREPEKYFKDIADLPALETLAVGGVAFDDECLKRLQSSTRLRELLLDSTSVTEEGLAALRTANASVAIYQSERLSVGDLRRLGQVQVERDTAWPTFASRTANQTGEVAAQVFLREATIDDTQAAPLAGLRQAEVLVLSGTQVSDVTLACVRGLKRLKLLYLDGTQIGDDGLEQVARLDQLNVLYLDNTRVTDRGLLHLAGLRELKVLGLSGTAVTPEGIAELRRALPNLRVFP